MKGCQKKHFYTIALFALVIFLASGTLHTIMTAQPWRYVYLQSFVYTMTCTFFCASLICYFNDRISRYPRLAYFSLFISLVVVGVFLGVIAASLILKQKIALARQPILFSLVFGLVSSIVITAYMILKQNLEEKITRIKEIEVENERLKRIELEARLSSLQAKLNPHFLFNALNSTAALIYDNPAKAEESIVQLSDLYRKIFFISNQNFITLSQEIDLIEDMLELEKLRFEENLSFRIVCPAPLRATKIPGLLIEPLVENVIKHAHGRDNRAVHVEIDIKNEADHLAISVTDNGAGFDAGKADPGFGLYSIQERLRLLFGDSGRLDIASEPGKGTTVKLRIPISGHQHLRTN
ncbi:MAG: sensor histidine kinase [Candidatus Zhuqueibacterota bacterium]